MTSPIQRDASGWSANLYNETASFVYSDANTAPILNLLNAKPGERILDLGCGSGEVTLQLARIVGTVPGGLAVGVDASESMVKKAKENGLDHAFVADAQAFQLPPPFNEEQFDAVFSTATLHWCSRDPSGVLDCVKKALKPNGRFVLEMGGYLNCVGIRSALYHVLRSRGVDPRPLDPWYFPSVEEYSQLLTRAGFKIEHISLNPRLTPIPAGVYAWLNLFARQSFLKGFDDQAAEEVLREVEKILEVDCKTAEGTWALMYMRLRVVATLN